jgi:Spy/CpxP family protein refolding chaperone
MNNPWIKYAGVLVLGVLLGLAAGAWTARHHFFKSMGAVERRDPGQRILKKLDSELKLTPDQRTKVEAIFAENRRKMDALRAEIEPKMEALRKATEPRFEALKKENEDAIRKVLTPEQAKKYDEIKARWEKKHPRMGGHEGFMQGHGGTPPPGMHPPGPEAPQNK